MRASLSRLLATFVLFLSFPSQSAATVYQPRAVLVQSLNQRFIYVSAAYVGQEDGSPERPYNTIAEALDAAQEGDSILVAGGGGLVYTEMIKVLKPVHLYGGYDADSWQRDLRTKETIINGNGEGTVVTIGPWLTDRRDIEFEGFTIQNGNGLRGGGLLIDRASPRVLRNRISGNFALQSGGGIAIQDASPTILENIVEVNSAGSEGGGGIYITRSSALITDNQIIANSIWGADGGGIKIEGQSRPFLSGNILISNNAHQGAGLYIADSSQAIMANSVIAFNTATGRGGGVVVDAASVEMINVSMISNQATQANSGLIAFGATAAISITNSILWGHGGDDVAGSGISVRYSDVEEGVLPGPGNLSVEPQLSKIQELDFHLQVRSPLVDAGTNDITLEADFEGDQRLFDGDGDGLVRADIGADEVAANLSLSCKRMMAADSFPVPGGYLSYMITLTNSGRLNVPAARLTDTLPASLRLRPESLRASAGVYQAGENRFTWQGPLSTSLPVTIAFYADILEDAEIGHPITNSAEVAYGSDVRLSLTATAITTEKRIVHLPLLSKRR